MPKYKFKAMDLNNKKIKGIFIASDENDLKDIIENQNYYLLSYKKVRESSQLFGFLERVKLRDFTVFCRQFAIMLKAGLNIDKAVAILKTSTKNNKLKNILEVVYNDLMKGKMLSEAFGRYPKTFPLFFRNMVEIGEKSGKLDLIFLRLADYYEKNAKTKSKVKQALAYPCFLLAMIVGVFLVISLFVMPNFNKMFAEFNAELPIISVIVMEISNFMQNNILNIMAIVVILVTTLTILGKNKKIKRFYDTMKLQLPIIREVTIASITSMFASSLSVLLSSGIPLLTAMDTISHLVGNKMVEEKLNVVKNEISGGKNVAKSIETINFFPHMLVEMISVGEVTGNLEEVLEKIDVYFEEELDLEIKKATSAIEPMMILIIGAMIAFVLLAIFLPMLDLMSTIDQQG